MNKETLNALWAFALENTGDAGHGEGHIRRVHKNALELMKSYPDCHKDALMAAAILHDCAQREQNEDPRVHHAHLGAEKAKKLLISLGEDEALAQKVASIIYVHSDPQAAKAAGTEASLLFDADKLDMCGAVGVTRGIMYALEHEGAKIADVLKGDIEFVENNLITEQAKALARDRIALSREFLNSLLKETEE